MAQVLVPGVAQAVLNGFHGAQPWACVTHWKYDNQTGPWTQTAIQQLADNLSSAWNSNAAAIIATQVTLASVATVDIGTASPAVGSNTTSHVGTGGPALNSAAICAVMSMHIPLRYRGGHPRIYLPWGIQTSAATESTWTAGFITASQTAWTNIVNAVRTAIPPAGGAQVSQVVPLYTYQYTDDPVHHKYTKQRTGLKGVFVVQSYQLNPTFGTQRRRLTAG